MNEELTIYTYINNR